MKEYRSKLTLGIAVQDGNYTGRTGTAETNEQSSPTIVKELNNYGTEVLGLTYQFWVVQEPYFSKFVVPELAHKRIPAKCVSDEQQNL